MKLTVIQSTDLASASDDKLAQAIAEQIGAFKRHLHSAGLIKARMGVFLLMVKETRAHGEFGAFLDKHFHGARSTLANWMKAAQNFCEVEGIVSAKIVTKLAPVVDTQLELWSDPEAKLEGMARKFAKWASGRSLRELIDGAEDDEDSPSKGRTLPPAAKGRKQRSATLTSHDDAVTDAAEVLRLLATESWRSLDHDELHAHALAVRNAAEKMIAELKPAKGGKKA